MHRELRRTLLCLLLCLDLFSQRLLIRRIKLYLPSDRVRATRRENTTPCTPCREKFGVCSWQIALGLLIGQEIIVGFDRGNLASASQSNSNCMSPRQCSPSWTRQGHAGHLEPARSVACAKTTLETETLPVCRRSFVRNVKNIDKRSRRRYLCGRIVHALQARIAGRDPVTFAIIAVI